MSSRSVPQLIATWRTLEMHAGPSLEARLNNWSPQRRSVIDVTTSGALGYFEGILLIRDIANQELLLARFTDEDGLYREMQSAFRLLGDIAADS